MQIEKSRDLEEEEEKLVKASLLGVLIIDLTLKECCSHAEQKEARTGRNSTMRLNAILLDIQAVLR